MDYFIPTIKYSNAFKTALIFLLLAICPKIVLSQVNVTIRVDPTTILNAIPSNFSGISYEMSSIDKSGNSQFDSTNTTLLNLFNTAGIKSFRIGANTVETSTWTGVPRSGSTPTGMITPTDVDKLFGFAKKSANTVIWGINLSVYDPLLAAQEASYIWKNHPSQLMAFEIGNEPDLYYKNGIRTSSYSYSNFITEFTNYKDSIRKYNPTAPISGPCSANSETTWTIPFSQAMEGQFNVLTQHFYVGGAGAAPAPNQIMTLLSAATDDKEAAYGLELANAATVANVPFRMSETNSFYNGGQLGASNTMASALWALDYMYVLASNKVSGINFHNPSNGPYSIWDYTSGTYSVQPMYYGLLAFNQGSKGSLVSTSANTNGLNFTSYSVLGTDNTLYVTLINKDTLQAAHVTINAGNNYNSNATSMQMTASSISATSGVTFAGSAVSSTGLWNPIANTINGVNNTFTITMPAASATVLTIKSSNTATATTLPIVDPELDLQIYPNPASGNATIKTSEPGTISITDEKGSLIKQFTIQGTVPTSVSDLPNGMYFVHYDNATISVVKKLIVK
jgi:hypothetical protein